MIPTVVYTLKKMFGRPIQICRMVGSVTDPLTGIKTQDIQRVDIDKAVILPNELVRQFLSRDTVAKYGAYLDTSKRALLIDNRDLPPSMIPQMEDWFIYQDKGYWVEMTSDYLGEATVVIGNNIVGKLKYQVINEDVRQRLTGVDNAT